MGQSHSLLLSAGVLLALVTYVLYTQVILPAMRPQIVPGPPSAHWFYGNMRETWSNQRGEMHEELLKKYGPVVSYFGLGNVRLPSLARKMEADSRTSRSPASSRLIPAR